MNEFSEVTEWLHRDVDGSIEYEIISTGREGVNYLASSYHNIGFWDARGEVEYKFAKELEKGDKLIVFEPGVENKEDLTITST